MNAQFPQGLPPHGGPVPNPPKRGLGTGWIVTIVAGSLVAVLVTVLVIGWAIGAFAFLGGGVSSFAKIEGKYGAAPLPSCEEVAGRVGNLPRNSSDTKLEGSKGWLCTFTNSGEGLTVNLDLEVNNVQRQRDKFDVSTSSGASVLDPTVRLGEKAAWGLVPTGSNCKLTVLDSNATLDIGLDDWNAASDDLTTCKIRVLAIAQTFYDSIQPR
ncbi:hypothetical protein OG943_34650 [Amycolatopsis sp. NBC_00345]|uniref:hypothetical protein n=1 Tax=Amycolatopsis sp. NBC_00345 TaxID=2975955 RepID=UPI002E25B3AE